MPVVSQDAGLEFLHALMAAASAVEGVAVVVETAVESAAIAWSTAVIERPCLAGNARV